MNSHNTRVENVSVRALRYRKDSERFTSTGTSRNWGDREDIRDTRSHFSLFRDREFARRTPTRFIARCSLYRRNSEIHRRQHEHFRERVVRADTRHALCRHRKRRLRNRGVTRLISGGADVDIRRRTSRYLYDREYWGGWRKRSNGITIRTRRLGRKTRGTRSPEKRRSLLIPCRIDLAIRCRAISASHAHLCASARRRILNARRRMRAAMPASTCCLSARSFSPTRENILNVEKKNIDMRNTCTYIILYDIQRFIGQFSRSASFSNRRLWYLEHRKCRISKMKGFDTYNIEISKISNIEI